MTYATTDYETFLDLVATWWFPQWKTMKHGWNPDFIRGFFEDSGADRYAPSLVERAMRNLLRLKFAPKADDLRLEMRDLQPGGAPRGHHAGAPMTCRYCGGVGTMSVAYQVDADGHADLATVRHWLDPQTQAPGWYVFAIPCTCTTASAPHHITDIRNMAVEEFDLMQEGLAQRDAPTIKTILARTRTVGAEGREAPLAARPAISAGGDAVQRHEAPPTPQIEKLKAAPDGTLDPERTQADVDFEKWVEEG